METKDLVALLINVLSAFAAIAAAIIAKRAVGSQHTSKGGLSTTLYLFVQQNF
jgi:hypothetical protein